MRRKELALIILLFIFNFSCYDGEDIKASIKIEYDGNWSALITLDYEETEYSGTGLRTFNFDNPGRLKISARKLDSTLDKIAVYIYEYERIVESDSTREPEASVSAEYEFPY